MRLLLQCWSESWIVVAAGSEPCTGARTVRASIAFRALDKVAPHVERGRQLQHDVGERRMLQQLRPGQGRFAARPLVPAAEAPV